MKNKRISHLVFILILFLCAAILLGGKWIYDVNIAYRLESHSARHRSLIFEPFSGKLFDIDLDMVKTVFIQKQYYYNSRGSTILPNTDAYREYYGNLERYVVRFDEAVPEKRKAAVKAINAFRYHAWLPYNWNPVHEPWYLPHFVILFYDGTGLTERKLHLGWGMRKRGRGSLVGRWPKRRLVLWRPRPIRRADGAGIGILIPYKSIKA